MAWSTISKGPSHRLALSTSELELPTLRPPSSAADDDDDAEGGHLGPPRSLDRRPESRDCSQRLQ